jgi:RsiW-degrading membrane proteinase PrsW (M82 family)
VTISIKCPACSKTLKAPGEMAGKRARCPNCKQPVAIPAAPAPKELPKPENAFGLSPLGASDSLLGPSPLEALNPLVPQDNWSTADLSGPMLTAPPSQRRASYIAPATTPTAGWRFWLFSLTLVPLALALLSPERGQIDWPGSSEEPTRSDESTPSEDPISIEAPIPDEETFDSDNGEIIDNLEDMDLEDLVKLFPDNRLPGAHLARDSSLHWFYALAAGSLFFGLIVLLFQQGQATRGHLLGVALLTATCGVLSLIMFQWFATAGSFLRFAGIFGIFSLVIRLIGFSYAAAMNPDNGFLISLVGFTFGVGLCEEFIKAIPIIARFRNEYELDWRGACVWGLASGVGFGVAEGIIYSSDYYNGIAGIDMYVVRFISCVALHALWSASVGILLWHHQDAVRGEMEWGDWGLAILKVQGVAMLLHGLYDTLLKREMTALALLVALASFGFLVWLIRWTLETELQPARKVRM